jgi:hypothetical protein
MKKLIVLSACLLCALAGKAYQLIKPSVKTPTSFAIFIDQKSYDRVADAVKAYRNSIEADHLGTYLVVDDWQNPEAIKKLIVEWHSDRKQPLEGAVFVGDIPIPMIRDAQHLTSAFKMDHRHDWKESSVASDRFYDDLDLKFRFLKQDKDKPLYFYYSLRADSKQFLSPDIYTGRIKPLELKGVDKYKMLADYLYKVARLKKAEAGNVLDNLTMARGHSYNSEDRNAWAGEQMALREQMPQLFKVGSTVKFMDFDMFYPAKKIYLNEVMNRNLDVLLFHHHGAPDTQYLNGYEEVSNIGPSIENIKRYLRSKIPAAAKKVGRDSAVARYARDYDVPKSWCEEAFDPAKLLADSIAGADEDIYTSDIRKITPNARFVLFDACFNGSFYEDDNIAGSYIFNAGKTIATIGGTVNALQDKWPDEFVGLLASGLRVGQFNRFSGYLESHLIGDPTFRFKSNSGLPFDINEAVTLHYKDSKFWRSKLNSSVPDVQAMALRQLQLSGAADVVNILKNAYLKSNDFVVRMEAIKLLALFHSREAVDVLPEALNDSYELVRRLSMIYVQKNGDPQLLPAVIRTYLQRGQEQRLAFHVLTGFDAFDPDNVLQELEKQSAQLQLYSDTVVTRLARRVRNFKEDQTETLKRINDTKVKARSRANLIYRYRNNPEAAVIPDLLKIAANEQEDKVVRLAAVQTLGWFDTNYKRADIVAGLSQIKTTDAELSEEVQRSIQRLR